MALAAWFSLVRFSHSIFALPFALMGAWLAGSGVPSVRVFSLVIVCAVAARTAAMGFNRLLDRHIDARNPRTAQRELPRGVLRPRAVAVLVIVASVVFVAGAFQLNQLSGLLALPVLFILLGYSAVKRVSWLAHAVLGLCLGIAPLGAWMAVRGDFGGDLLVPLMLALGVLAWVMGFDLVYACQDVEFDRGARLHSIPTRFGVGFALRLSSLLHVATALALCVVGWRADLGWIYFSVLAIAGVLLVWQHRIVTPSDLSRVNMAFFSLNGWVSVALFLGTALDMAFLETRGVGV